MKISVLQENLNTALTNASRFVSNKNQLPILNNILLSTDDGRLKISATNLELSVNYWIGAKIEKEGSITLPPKEITEFVSYLSPGKIDLSLDNNLLSLSSTKTNSSFTTIPSIDYPEFPKLDPKTSFELDANVFLNSLSQIIFSAAIEDIRPVLTAVLCCFNEEGLILVATDGFRLSLKEIKIPTNLNFNKDKSVKLLIPAKSLNEIIKMAKNNQKVKMGLSTDEHQIIFVLDDIEVISRLIEGDYPDYQKIIPSDYSTKIFINKDELLQAVKVTSVFAKESANVIKLNIKSDHVELSANAPQVGQNKTIVDAKIEGEGLEIAFNYKFLSDFLTNCKSQEITINLNDSLSPANFCDQSDTNLTHIIMPVRLQD